MRAFTLTAGGALLSALAFASMASAADRVKPCSLLTKDEVSSALGSDISKVEDMAGPKICKYYLSNGDQFALNASSGNPGDYLDRMIKRLGSSVTTSATGDVGDKAYLRTSSPTGIYTQKGDVYLSMVAVTKKAPSQDTLKDLANKALGRAQ
jgi:hypothetical protein